MVLTLPFLETEWSVFYNCYDPQDALEVTMSDSGVPRSFHPSFFPSLSFSLRTLFFETQLPCCEEVLSTQRPHANALGQFPVRVQAADSIHSCERTSLQMNPVEFSDTVG